jgi:A/G-specific adenine glycosylase
MSSPGPHTPDVLVEWFDRAARTLPWRDPDTTPWGVLVSEVMLQQTPVARVVPVYLQWLARWPQPRDLADDEPAEAIRMWGRLGYPRRALRLHQSAKVLLQRHDGAVPEDLGMLLSLPGVGDYTARAVLAFGFGRRSPVVDVNVRRVLARAVAGEPDAGPATTASDRALADGLIPQEDALGSRTAAALMELGAVICTARTPSCEQCPISSDCRWYSRGRPAGTTAPRRGQGYAGTDRQARGRLLEAVRTASQPVPADTLALLWEDPEQRTRSLRSLVSDGLLVRGRDDTYSLPRT